MSTQHQLLEALRRRMAEASESAVRFAPPPAPRTIRADFERAIPGREIENAAGKHWQSGRSWDKFKRHGSVAIADLNELPEDLLGAISSNEIGASHPERWAFLDTETTGLSGGSGTCAFLCGVGRIGPDGFRVRQYFMRDYDEEASMLEAMERDLEGVETLITFNGKCFDLPLLETRYRMHRRRSPFSSMAHLDLLHGARRLWRLRYESCRLTELESQVLGHLREGDVPGELIPLIYFDYLRTKTAWRLAPVFLHNALDIVSLACLTAIVPWVFRDAAGAPLHHPAEMVSLARWLRRAGQEDQALILFHRAVESRLRDDLLFRTLLDIGHLEKKRGNTDAALAAFSQLAATPNAHRAAALEELAKHYEHRERNFAMALDLTETALAAHSSESLRKRHARLLVRIALCRTLP